MKTIDRLKLNLFLRAFSFWKIPLLGWVRPQILEMDEAKTVLKIPLGRRSKNHLGVMYFGALAMGAEAAVALRAVLEIHNSKRSVDFLFKDFDGKFLKRAEGDVHFICEQGQEVRAVINRAIQSGERVNETFRSYAVVPSRDANEVIGEFRVTLSAKLRQKKT